MVNEIIHYAIFLPSSRPPPQAQISSSTPQSRTS